MALLEVNDVTASYGAVTALRGVTMEVDAGEAIALLGANGAGKSTTLRLISGLVSPDDGTVVLDGKPIHGLPAHKVVGHGVGQVPEGRELFPDLTVEENLRYGYWPRHKDKAGYQRQLDMAFDLFPRLKERRKQHAITLSGGEQQMLVVARALMSSPKVLMCDELSLGLAPKIVSQLYDILAAVNAEGTAVIIVEQFVHTALRNTDRAYVLEKGQVVVDGKSSELADSPELLAAYLGGEATEGADAGAEAVAS